MEKYPQPIKALDYESKQLPTISKNAINQLASWNFYVDTSQFDHKNRLYYEMIADIRKSQQKRLTPYLI